MFIQLAGSRRSWQKPGGAIISLVMILSMLILSFILYFEFRISGRYLLSEESGYLLFIFGKEDFNEADKKFSDLRNVCGFGDCAAHRVPYDSGCGKGFPAYAYSGAAVRAAVRAGVRLGMRYFSAAAFPALNPEQTDYFYFATDKAGKYYYAKTLAEHQKNWNAIKKVNAALTTAAQANTNADD